MRPSSILGGGIVYIVQSHLFFKWEILLLDITKQSQYERNREILFTNPEVCEENRELFKKFFKQKEYQLKRKNGIGKLTERQYKTLCQYLPGVRNINNWFGNKPLEKATRADIKKVYDDLEDDKLVGINGHKIKCKRDYYQKYFKSDLFRMIGKYDIACDVMRYCDSSKDIHRLSDTQLNEFTHIFNSRIN